MKFFPAAVLCLGIALSPACTLIGPPSRPSSAPSAAVSAALNDYTKPYLSDTKMTRLLDSMKEDRNPFEVIFSRGGLANLLTIQQRVEEFNAYARRYGFEGYEDYMAVWGRVMVGQMQIAATDMQKGLGQTMQKTLADAEENLKKPGLTPEMKQMYEEQVKSAKEAMTDLQKTDEKTLNAQDLELVRKYNPQITEALKRYSKRTQEN